MQSIGILGVGELTEKVVIGLRRDGFDGDINLSPRNQERAANIATSCKCVVMASNQDVIDRSEVLVLGVRPDAVEKVAKESRVVPGQLLISLVAGMPTAELERHFEGAKVVRTMLSYAAEINQSTVVVSPANATAEGVLERLGSLVVLEEEAQFELATVAACMNGWFYFFLHDLQQWFVSNGLQSAHARQLVAGNMQDCLATIQSSPKRSLESLGSAIATPGTYTEIGLEVLKQHRSSEAWRIASNAVLGRLTKAD